MVDEIAPQVGDEITVMGPGSPHNGERYKVLAIDRNRLHVLSPSSGKQYRFPKMGRFRFKVEHPPETAANENQRLAVEEVATDEIDELTPEEHQHAEAPPADAPDELPPEDAAALAAQQAAQRAAVRPARSPRAPFAADANGLAALEADIRAQIARLQGQLEGIKLCRQALSRSR